MSHSGKNFSERIYSQVNCILRSLHGLIKLPNPPSCTSPLWGDKLRTLIPCRSADKGSCLELNTINWSQAHSHAHKQAPRGFCPDLGICLLGREEWEDGQCGEGQGIGVHDEVEWKERHAESMENMRPGEARPRNFNEKHHSESVTVDNQNLNVLTPISQTLPHGDAFLKNEVLFHLTWHIPNLLPIKGAQKT